VIYSFTPPKKQRGRVAKLWIAQGGRCFHCDETMLHNVRPDHPRCWSREHLFPRSTHPQSDGENPTVLAHRECNAARGNRPPTFEDIARARAICEAAGVTFRIVPMIVRRRLWAGLAPGDPERQEEIPF
jgi:hypothetical protein